MALKAWLASLQGDVTAVTGVQVPVGGVLGCNGMEVVGVTGVTDRGTLAANETAVTVGEKKALQPQPAWVLGCTRVTGVMAENINTDGQHSDGEDEAATTATTKADAATDTDTDTDTDTAGAPTQPEPKRVFRPRGSWLTDSEATDAQAYHAHHFHCPTCIAAGRGGSQYGERCAQGLALWHRYNGTSDANGAGCFNPKSSSDSVDA